MRDISPACWQWIEHKIPRLVQSIHVEGPHAGHKGHHRHLHIFAYDTPETDSHIKQLAVHVGELVNRRYITVTKEGSQGSQSWRLTNKNYNGQHAHPHAIEFQHTAPTWSA